MFKRLSLRFQDMKTISKLISGADKQANLSGEEEAGAEHFVLSALNLDEGSAKRVFGQLNIDVDKFREAISQQYADALSTVGIEGDTNVSHEPIVSDKVFRNSQPSGNDLMKSLYALKKKDKDRPLLGAHVIRVASEIEHGVVARAFNVLSINKEQLAQAISDELG